MGLMFSRALCLGAPNKSSVHSFGEAMGIAHNILEIYSKYSKKLRVFNWAKSWSRD